MFLNCLSVKASYNTMLMPLHSSRRLLKTWRIDTRGQEALTATRALVRHLSSEPPESGDKEAEDKSAQQAEDGSQSAAPETQVAAATSEQHDAASNASLPPQSPGSAPETSAAPTSAGVTIKRTNYARYNAAAPAATTVDQHYADTLALDHSILKDEFLDGPGEPGSDPGSPVEPEPPQLTALESELKNAVNDQYGEFGVTVEDLRTYLDVSLDIEDAITAGRKANIEPDRYTLYERVDQLIKFGPEKSPEEEKRLDDLAEDEMLSYPWPSTMVRQYLKDKHGVKLRRMKKDTQTQYDQGWMTDTILPFDSEDEMKYAFSKQADPKVISSYWEDELNDDGQVQRFPQRSVGTEDLSDWAQAVAAAMITPAEDPSKMFGIQDDVEDATDSDTIGGPAGNEKSTASLHRSVAQMAGVEVSEIEAASSPLLPAPQSLEEEDESEDEDAYGQLGPTIVFEGGEHEHRQPDALGALMEAKFGVDKMHGLPPEERQRLNKMAAAAITDAAFKEQESSILRTHGYDPEQLDSFLSELGMNEEDWQEWVKQEVMQNLERLGRVQMDHRSPQDMIEDFVASQSLVAPWAGPANDMREVVENHPMGPTSEYHILPEIMREEEDDRHPAGEKALWDSVIDGSNCEFAAPEIFKFDQKIMMHLHDQPYHPSNKRITLRVRLEDLKMKYGLSDEAIIHIVTIAGKRYNPNNGVISISCDRHRAREENRRQALHWALRLVESALLQHPSEQWEAIKEMQSKALEHIDTPALCPFASFIQEDDDDQPVQTAQESTASMKSPSTPPP